MREVTWHGVAWRCKAWHGDVGYGTAWYGRVITPNRFNPDSVIFNPNDSRKLDEGSGVARYDMACYGGVRCGAAWHGKDKRGTIPLFQ